MAWQGGARTRQDLDWQAGLGKSRLAWFGAVRRTEAGMGRQGGARRVQVRYGVARQAGCGKARVFGHGGNRQGFQMSYSATVKLWLTYGDKRIDLRQVGPTFVITDHAEQLRVGDVVTVFVSVDGKVNHMERPCTVSRIEGNRVWTDLTPPPN